MDEGPPLDSGGMRGYLKTDLSNQCFWFELSNERLSYFENKDCPEPLGSLNVDDMRSIQARKRNQREYVMRINTVDSSFEKSLAETSTMVRESAPPSAPSSSAALPPAGASTGGPSARLSSPSSLSRAATTTAGEADYGGMLSWMRKLLPGGDAMPKRSASDAAGARAIMLPLLRPRESPRGKGLVHRDPTPQHTLLPRAPPPAAMIVATGQ